MKIKLVTFAPHPNFGTCLQSYALNKVLRDMGHDVEFLYNGRENPKQSLWQKFLNLLSLFLPRNVVSLFFRKTKRSSSVVKLNVLQLPDSRLRWFLNKLFPSALIQWEMFTKQRMGLQWKKVISYTFKDGNYNMRHLYAKRDYEDAVKDADLFITGSDQIWNPYCGGFNPMMFLEFVGGRRRCVAYSSSVSLSSFPVEVIERVKSCLKNFETIAVRETDTATMLNTLLNRVDVRQVVDPTYLLSVEEWTAFGNRATLEFDLPKKYIFCYCIGGRAEVYNEVLAKVKQLTGIEKVINLEYRNRKDANWGEGMLYADAGPYEWVHLLMNSSYVVMDSFHATVFALKFKKDFVHVLKNAEETEESQNSRMYDILNRYNLRYKIYGSDDNWKSSVDYSKVTPLMTVETVDSLNFLRSEIGC